MHYAGGKKVVQSTTLVAPHTMLQVIQARAHLGCSKNSRVADQYVKGIDDERRRIICVLDPNSSMHVKTKACMACGRVEGVSIDKVVAVSDPGLGARICGRTWKICDMDEMERRKRTGAAMRKLGSCCMVQYRKKPPFQYLD